MKFCSLSSQIKQVESKWKKIWEEKSTEKLKIPFSGKNSLSSNNLYCLSMFPYPTETLSMNNLRVYLTSDLIKRYYSFLKNRNVINPIGWDSFGLPTESEAIKLNINPKTYTNKNIAEIKAQFSELGINFDYDMELSTSNPDYYKWTQWLFLELYKNGLAYKKEAEVNWDPVNKTVLANEQVDSDGNSWLSGAKVEKRMMKQWFIKTTEYAEELETDLIALKEWPIEVRNTQKDWLGVSFGAKINFSIYDTRNLGLDGITKKTKILTQIEVFTTRPETIYGVSFIALNVDHDFIKLSGLLEEENFAKKYKHFMESKGEASLLLEGFTGVNPVSFSERLPIYLSKSVVKTHGSGIINN